MTDFQSCVDALRALQGNHPKERDLLDLEIVSCAELDTTASGCTYHVVLGNGEEAYHKPHDGLSTSTVHSFGHSADTPPLHECAAWQFAVALGERYSRLLPPTVYREVDGRHGSLALHLSGIKRRPGDAFLDGNEQVCDAGFFDVLVGQQDRHRGNLMWDRDAKRLGLFDHGFCFPMDPDSFVDPTEGRRHRVRSAVLVDQRRYSAMPLTTDEIRLVERVLGSGDLLGVRPVLEAPRAEAMVHRLEALLQPPAVIPKVK